MIISGLVFVFKFFTAVAATSTHAQRWDPYLLKLSYAAPSVAREKLLKLKLPEPPRNKFVLERECNILRGYVHKRTPEKLRDILAERQVSSVFGPFDLASLDVEDPIAVYIRKAYEAALPVIFRLKREVNRVRPHVFCQNLNPFRAVPHHPSYPSGHSTQAHLTAFLLIELSRDHEDLFQRKAATIARNREIAGYHYSSDSIAGKILAHAISKALLEDAEFKKLKESALKSWNSQRVDFEKNHLLFRHADSAIDSEPLPLSFH